MNTTDKTIFVFVYEMDTIEEGKWGLVIWKISLN